MQERTFGRAGGWQLGRALQAAEQESFIPSEIELKAAGDEPELDPKRRR